jgi:hypothetical protein
MRRSPVLRVTPVRMKRQRASVTVQSAGQVCFNHRLVNRTAFHVRKEAAATVRVRRRAFRVQWDAMPMKWSQRFANRAQVARMRPQRAVKCVRTAHWAKRAQQRKAPHARIVPQDDSQIKSDKAHAPNVPVVSEHPCKLRAPLNLRRPLHCRSLADVALCASLCPCA